MSREFAYTCKNNICTQTEENYSVSRSQLACVSVLFAGREKKTLSKVLKRTVVCYVSSLELPFFQLVWGAASHLREKKNREKKERKES